MAPTPKLDQYAILRAAILENDERDAKVAKLLRDRARARAERKRCGEYVGRPDMHALGAIMAEADWEAEIWLIDREEASLP